MLGVAISYAYAYDMHMTTNPFDIRPLHRIAVLASVGVAFLIYRRVVGGVRKVSGAAVAIAGGEFDQEVELGGNDELSDMVAEFHSMVTYLGDMADTASRIAEGEPGALAPS